jgi:P-type Ca2+ transporter type 2C
VSRKNLEDAFCLRPATLPLPPSLLLYLLYLFGNSSNFHFPPQLPVGFIQESRSEKSLEALSALVPHYAHLLRDSHLRTCLANVLVPGDIVTFSTGDRIPSDLRIISCESLTVDESNLTGEAKEVEKKVNEDGTVGGGDEASNEGMCFMGTLVKGGRGKGVVIATGIKTEFGKVWEMMEDVCCSFISLKLR